MNEYAYVCRATCTVARLKIQVPVSPEVNQRETVFHGRIVRRRVNDSAMGKREKRGTCLRNDRRATIIISEPRGEARKYLFRSIHSSDLIREGLTRRFPSALEFSQRPGNDIESLAPMTRLIDENRSRHSPRTIYFCGTFTRARFTFFSRSSAG